MVTQQQAAERYIKMQADYEGLNKLIEYRFDDLQNGINAINKSVTEHFLQYENRNIDHEDRIQKLEYFESKVIYFYTAISMIVGIFIGWKLI